MAQRARMAGCYVSDFRQLGDILINDVLPLLKITPEEINKNKIGKLEENNLTKEEDGESSD